MRSQIAFVLILCCAACSRSDTHPAPAEPPAQAPASPANPASNTVNGKVPDLQPGVSAFVVLQPKPAHEFPAPADPPVMDQVGQTFGPAVLFVRTGQPVEFRNSDDTLHNVHVTDEDTREPAFNVAIPTGNSYNYTFKQDGFYHVGCDIHPAMSAEIVSTSSPYAIEADADGSYAFEDVAPGTYTLTIYVGGKKTERDVTVTAPRPRGTPSPE